jgi:hypothetical protein
MSLVVAQTTPEGPRIVSDTRVTFPDPARPRFTTDSLKAVVISRDVTVCFAGDLVRGLEGVRLLARIIAAGGATDDALPALLGIASDGATAADFILATAGANDSLTRVRQSGVERALEATWIGDHDAFEIFQAARKAQSIARQVWDQNLPPGAKAMGALSDAMQAVIRDPAVPSVDGFSVGVTVRPNGFQYMSSMFIMVGRDLRIESGEDLVSRMAHPVAEGGYSVCVVAPAECGTPALGLSFPRARLGMIYLPLLNDGAEVIRDVSPNDYPALVLERYGIAMEMPMLLERR